MRKAWLLCCAIGLAPVAHAQPLSLSDAVAHAGTQAPSVTAATAAADGARRTITPSGQLPDPQLVLGLQNIPIEGADRYRLNRDQMTMQTVGVMQDMPNPWKLAARTDVARADAERAEANLDVTRLDARMNAARAWINLYYANARVTALDRLAREAHASAAAGRARLAAGGGVEDAIAAEVEAARIDDRRADAGAAIVAAREELRRWIGTEADEALTVEAPRFAVDADRLRARLVQHPALAAYAAERDLAHAQVRAAEAEGVPDWSWSLQYQHRDPSFGDMASVEVRIGLPLFQPWRQGPLVAARRDDETRVEAERNGAQRQI
ncbi:MAG: TolC family protein, partial [Proteobacteria bacterium]|nr:TolC family protein [Pseudomonadota bacterium]